MKKSKHNINKINIILAASGAVMLVGGIACAAVGLTMPRETPRGVSFPKLPTATTTNKIYSKLTGLELSSEAEVTAPTYCIQTPNGTDGARPHAGLDEAGVVFEAIAEAGITRFAAIYQNPTAAVIGPIRSLRLYYLQWDTPFDCTIVHAGGADDAIAAVRSGGYKDLSENYEYMYRGTYGGRLWNNLFTTATYLKQFSTDTGFVTSEVDGFLRMTPAEARKAQVDETATEKLNIIQPATQNTSTLEPQVSGIAVNFGGWADFNVRYAYDAETNTYARSYESGDPMEVYRCPSENLGEVNPEDQCELTQMTPAVVAVMFVEEQKAEDNYHEDITTVGSGGAYIFQNGISKRGTWRKNSVAEQIRFYDEAGGEILLAPGQTFVEAIPGYGSLEIW